MGQNLSRRQILRRFSYSAPWNISSRNAPLAIAKTLPVILKDKIMKKLIIFITILFITQINIVKGQCFADAGEDEVGCTDWYGGVDSTMIGGDPSAFGGTPPYTYAWEVNNNYYPFTLTASDFLNDTTLANPLVISNWWVEDPVEFILYVTDAHNFTCTDTIIVTFSYFSYTNGYVNYYINQGDSVYCFGWESIFGGIPPLEYLWRPNHGLSDSIGNAFWAKPDYSIAYYPIVTDAAGCTAVGGTSYNIIVSPVKVSNQKTERKNILTSMNKDNSVLTIRIEPKTFDYLKLKIFDMSGKEIKDISFDNSEVKVEIIELPPGIYINKVYNQKDCIGESKFIKNNR